MFNAAYSKVLGSGGITVGLMMPAMRDADAMANIADEIEVAKLADRLGFAALWTRDVPLMIPQGSGNEIAALDDPFVWLIALAAAAPNVALGTAAAVLPLRHPLHLAKAAISVDRVSGGRLILGLGSGDRPAEFSAFGIDATKNGELFREHWGILRSALAPSDSEQANLLRKTGGYRVSSLPTSRIPMLVIGSAKQSLQWIATNSDGWATYHREEQRQLGRIQLWANALAERLPEKKKPFVQSLHLDLAADPDLPAEPIELGIRTGSHALVTYLRRMSEWGVDHVLFNLAKNGRSAVEVVDELGKEVIPHLSSAE